MRKISRRDFLKSLGGLTAVSEKNQSQGSSKRDGKTPVIRQEKEVPVICTACDGGCGVLVTIRGDEVVDFEGDPDHPVNQGFLCEQGESFFSLSASRSWTPHLFYKPAGGAVWEIKDWGPIVCTIAQRVKNTRDAAIKRGSGAARSIGCLWDDSLLTNEEGYLLFKLFQALGVPVLNKGRYPGALSFRNWMSIADGYPLVNPKRRTRYPVVLMETWYGENMLADISYKTLQPEDGLTEWLTSGNTKGLFVWGGGLLPQEPENEMISILQSVEWLVMIDWFKTREDFAASSERIAETCPKTEVFLLPAAAPWEKSGSLISAGRWVQWCARVVEPSGQVRTPLWMIDRLFKLVRDLYQGDGDLPEPILKIKWDYSGNAIPDAELVAAEIERCFQESAQVFNEQAETSAESSMTCGLQLHSGYWGGKALSMRRSLDHGRWGFPLPQ